MKTIKELIIRYQKILKYASCSLITALIEMGLGWILLKIFPEYIVMTNSVAVVISAFVHYCITLKLVFVQDNSVESFLCYVFSFVIGLVLQNFLIWIMYEFVLKNMMEIIRYIISKGCSLIIPFFALYYVRSTLNQWIKNKNREER